MATTLPTRSLVLPKPGRAARWTASTFGVLAGLGGLTHGVGEVLQGNVPTDSLFIPSWTHGPIADYLGGDPGLTVIPNMLATGILATAVSLTVIVWSVAFVGRRRGGLTLVLLCMALLLVGGGVGPPVIGMLAGVAGLGIRARHAWWQEHLSTGVRRRLARLWPWTFGVAAVNGVFLVVGSVALVYLVALDAPDLFLNSFYFAVVSLAATIVTGIAYDVDAREPAVRPG